MAGEDIHLVRIGGMRVNMTALSRLSYRCKPHICGIRDNCCRRYDVWLDDREARRIEEMLPVLRRHFPEHSVPRDRRSVLRRITAGRYVLRKNDDGCCELSYRTDDGRLLCTLHTAALEEGIPLRKAKPRLCLLWPLSLSRADLPLLTVQNGVRSFPCCSSRPSAPTLHEGVAETVRMYFGADVLEDIQCRAGELYGARS